MAKHYIPYTGPRIIPRCVDLVVHKLCFEQEIENKYQFYYSGTAPTGAELTALAAEFGEAEYNGLRAYTTQGMRWTGVQATDINSLSGSRGDYIFPSGKIGNNIASDLPLNVACNISLRTHLRGHRFTGRKSYSGWTENIVDHNILGTEVLGQMGEMAAKLLTTYGGGKFTPAVGALPQVRLVGGVATVVAGSVCTPISSVYLPNNTVDSQKTRLTGRGR